MTCNSQLELGIWVRNLQTLYERHYEASHSGSVRLEILFLNFPMSHILHVAVPIYIVHLCFLEVETICLRFFVKWDYFKCFNNFFLELPHVLYTTCCSIHIVLNNVVFGTPTLTQNNSSWFTWSSNTFSLLF